MYCGVRFLAALYVPFSSPCTPTPHHRVRVFMLVIAVQSCSLPRNLWIADHGSIDLSRESVHSLRILCILPRSPRTLRGITCYVRLDFSISLSQRILALYALPMYRRQRSYNTPSLYDDSIVWSNTTMEFIYDDSGFDYCGNLVRRKRPWFKFSCMRLASDPNPSDLLSIPMQLRGSIAVLCQLSNPYK